MHWLFFVLFLLLPGLAHAQIGQVPQFVYHAGSTCTGGYKGQGDTLAGPQFSYGLRAVSCAYAAPGNNPAIDIRRVSDGTTTTIKILASGYFDATTASAFCASTTCYVSKWYDQTGNGNHAVQATTANQPQLSFSCSGLTVEPACLVFSGSQWLAGGSSSVASYVSVSMVIESTSTAKWAFGNGSPPYGIGFDNGANALSVNTGGTQAQVAATSGAFHAILVTQSSTYSVGIVEVDGGQFAPGLGSNALTAPWTVGSLTGAESADAFTGQIEEITGWSTQTTSAQETAVCHNQYVYVGTPTSC